MILTQSVEIVDRYVQDLFKVEITLDDLFGRVCLIVELFFFFLIEIQALVLLELFLLVQRNPFMCLLFQVLLDVGHQFLEILNPFAPSGRFIALPG